MGFLLQLETAFEITIKKAFLLIYKQIYDKITGGYNLDQYGDRYIRGSSTKWKNWMCMFKPTTCIPCKKKHGTIYPFDAIIESLHFHCYCELVPMRRIQAGKATKAKEAGVDLYLKYTGKLPVEYITKDYARTHGWKSIKGNLSDVLPGKVIGGDIFYNDAGKLPTAEGRTWYEADFDYSSGYRNDSQILYSSDGLLFVSYDHYKTFYEVY